MHKDTITSIKIKINVIDISKLRLCFKKLSLYFESYINSYVILQVNKKKISTLK